MIKGISEAKQQEGFWSFFDGRERPASRFPERGIQAIRHGMFHYYLLKAGPGALMAADG
ncbi:hypothetical protein GCM10007276_05500 [Agaricicola taiwanensis]|uniref:Uncharacterized protein n=1 Tax=Agaricicola taiwanensis TaxID=591372 RepID=A0A8J2VM03_9RHOB|nr:hypothetical protein GCM10007276_05500 [Agaricicola taiwanensis]